MEALIIAAGRENRLNHNFSSKSLIPIFGVSLIERIILRAKSAGITSFKIVVGYKADQIMKKIGSGDRYGVHVDYIFNPEWEKGNGSSVYKGKGFLKELHPFDVRPPL
jgi:NDP-sugar pyrophosphorylase family protein